MADHAGSATEAQEDESQGTLAAWFRVRGSGFIQPGASVEQGFETLSLGLPCAGSGARRPGARCARTRSASSGFLVSLACGRQAT